MNKIVKLITIFLLLSITTLCYGARIETEGAGGGGSGDITAVGDVASGAAFDGTQGNTLTFKGATSGTTTLAPTAIAGTTAITLPASTGTVLLKEQIDTYSELNTIVADKALVNKADGAVWLGVHDFGGAASVEVPNGANPTVSAAGQVSVDTSATSGSALRFYGDAQYTLPAWQRTGFVLLNPVATDDYPLPSFSANITIRQIRVLCTGGTNIIGGLDEADANGANAVAIDADITATAGTTATDDGSLTNPTVDANDMLNWHTTSILGTPTAVTVTVYYTYDAVN